MFRMLSYIYNCVPYDADTNLTKGVNFVGVDTKFDLKERKKNIGMK